jgi:hypothetical protein
MAVFICKWKKTSVGYKFWVKSNPRLFAEAEDVEQTWEKLQELILDDGVGKYCSYADIELEFEPPIPENIDIQKYYVPELFIIGGDGDFSLLRGFPKEKLYEHGLCSECNQPMGPRTNLPLAFESTSPVDAGSVDKCDSVIFSNIFIDMFNADERRLLKFIKCEKSKKSQKREFYELVGSPMIGFTGVNGFDHRGMEWTKCGHYSFFVDEPILGVPVSYFICRQDLPDPIPSCFTVGHGGEIKLCMTRQRWDEFRGKAKGLTSRRLGVVDIEQSARKPQLMKTPYGGACSWWPKPHDNDGAVRRCWDLPANDICWSSNPAMQWFLDQVKKQEQFKVVRQNISAEEMMKMLESGKRPEVPMVISFRCPDCNQLGRVVLTTKEFWMQW